MKKSTLLAEALSPEGEKFSLFERDGEYTIGINHPSYCRPPHESVTFEIPRSEEGPIEIRLAPAGKIEGRLRGYTPHYVPVSMEGPDALMNREVSVRLLEHEGAWMRGIAV